jgi:hypothetical protein
MKKIILLLSAILLLNFYTNAQVGDDDKKKDVEAIFAAYITKKLNLSVDEAQQFWPVFNTYRKEFRESIKDLDNDEIKRNEAIITVQKKYKPQFQKVLKTEDRANKVFKIQRDFLQKIKDRRQNRPNKGPRRV